MPIGKKVFKAVVTATRGPNKGKKYTRYFDSQTEMNKALGGKRYDAFRESLVKQTFRKSRRVPPAVKADVQRDISTLKKSVEYEKQHLADIKKRLWATESKRNSARTGYERIQLNQEISDLAHREKVAKEYLRKAEDKLAKMKNIEKYPRVKTMKNAPDVKMYWSDRLKKYVTIPE